MTESQYNNMAENAKKYLEWEDLKIDNRSRKAHCCLKEINISPKEYKILEFLKKFISFNIDKIKLVNSVESTLFENIKKLEIKTGFKEKPNASKEFFRKGTTNEWKNILTVEQIKLIEKKFRSEMRELNYL